MKELQKVMSKVRQAVQSYDMISDGDKIAVGLSGGKDSIALLYALWRMRDFFPKKYDVVGISIDLGFKGCIGYFDPLSDFCLGCGIEYKIVKTEIASIVFDERKEPNPCSLCSKLRRGALSAESAAVGANKIALGHHLDDAVETFMMSLLYEGRIGCFSPVTWYEDRKISVIRPLIYTKESDIRSLVKKVCLPCLKSPCPEDGNTEREHMKEYLHSFDREHRGLYRRILGAMERGEVDGWRTKQ